MPRLAPVPHRHYLFAHEQASLRSLRSAVKTTAGLTSEPTKSKSELQSSIGRRFHDVIPGGAHTYAKGDDQFPAEAPAAIVRGEGCRVWDVEGNVYVEYGAGLRAVTLGHSYPRVTRAAAEALGKGTNYTRPSLVELECAEQLTGLIAAADMVKFTKDGSTATTAGVKLARAHTGRDLVALCADHPFFSYDDWFFTTTVMTSGIPRGVAELSLAFRYNDLAGLEQLFAAHPGEIACVILEPERSEPPRGDFLRRVADLCRREGAVFILDEMITGFRWHIGGAQAVYAVEPDLSTFGKGIANGFSVSALMGRRELMELGGIETERERVFLLSTTHGAETHALAAAMATMDVYVEEDVVGALHEAGRRLRTGVESAASAAGVSDHVKVIGRDCNLVYETRDAQGTPSQPYRTLFMQELIRRGVLAPSFVVSYSHDERTIDATIEIVAEALEIYRRALEDGAERYLSGASVKPVYRRFN
jgi:glutamate-1-semialdehyde 2,1-aminomutase